MNHIYLTVKVLKKSKIGFDYYHKIKPYYVLTCNEIYRKQNKTSNIFKIVLYDKTCEKCNINELDVIYVDGICIKPEDEYIIIANNIYHFYL